MKVYKATEFSVIYLLCKKLEMTFMCQRKEMATHREDHLEALIKKYRFLNSILNLQNKNIQREVSGNYFFLISTPGDSYHSANIGNITLLYLQGRILFGYYILLPKNL